MTHSVTAQFRDYLLQCLGRTNELATYTIDQTQYFILMETGEYILMETGDKIFYEEAVVDAATYVINAQFRDYLLTAEQVDRE